MRLRASFLADPQKALAQADSGSFREVAANFVKPHVEASKLRSQPEIERCLDKYIYPAWEGRPFHELKRNDVANLLDQIEDQHGSRQADVCLAIISKMTNWYATRNHDYMSPIVRGMGRSKPVDRKRKRILDDDEIRALWSACDDMGTFGAIIRVCLSLSMFLERISKSPEEDNEAGELNEAKEVLWMIFPSDEDPALPLDPGEEAFDQPAPQEASQAAPVLRRRFRSVRAVRRDHLDAILT